MAIRTTKELVGGIVELDEEIDVSPFIETANALIDQVCLDSDYSETLLELIERWLSAHFYSLRDPLTDLEQVKSVRVQYRGQTKLGLDFTQYGQHAKLLDVDGNLAILDEGKVKLQAGIAWLGGYNESCED